MPILTRTVNALIVEIDIGIPPHLHEVLDRHELRPSFEHLDLAPSQTGKHVNAFLDTISR